MSANDNFDYKCECDSRKCDLTFAMPHDTYLDLASHGLVVHIECPSVKGKEVLYQAGDAIAVGRLKFVIPPNKKITHTVQGVNEKITGVKVWK